MKKTLTTLVCSLAAVAAFAQGTVNFANLVGTTLNQPIFLSDGTTRLSGATFQAELLGGSSSLSLSIIGATPFLSGGGAGYFLGGTRVITGVSEGALAFIQIHVWSTAFGATYAAALANPLSAQGNAWGSSSIFSVTTGAPTASPPTTPATLVGFQSFQLNAVPEPSMIALAGLGALSLLLFRRRK